MQDLGLTDQDILYLSESGTAKNSNITEAEIMANIMRDPILIGVTRRSIGCGIKDKPAIFGKIWKYIDWIEYQIQDSKPSTHECFPKYSPNQKSLEEKIRLKGPGILDLTTTPDPVTILHNFEQSVTKPTKKGAKDFDIEIEALFNKL